MFGYVTIYRKELSKAAVDCYQGYYCGLCDALGSRYGLLGRMTLSYDMTFLAVLLAALYEPETQKGTARCLPHPIVPRPRCSNEFVEYAAAMGIVLARYNFLDDWQDEGSEKARRNAEKLAEYLPQIQAKHPAQCEAIRTQLAELSQLENARSTDLDALCGSFGRLLGAVFRCREDLWAPLLERIGFHLGAFIYLVDAYDDLEKDKRSGSFNALAALAKQLSSTEFEERVHELLTQQMALCAESFSLLPILKDTPEGELLYNTLYSGVWCQYALTSKRRQKRMEGANKHA